MNGITPEELLELARFTDAAYTRDFRKVASPAICALIDKAIAHIREQEKARAEAQKLCRGIAVGWHRSTLKQMLDKSMKAAHDWLERYGETK